MIVTSSIWQKEMEKTPKPHCFLGKGGVSFIFKLSQLQWRMGGGLNVHPSFSLSKKSFQCCKF